MFSWIGRWINDRWPLDALIRLGLKEEMIGGTSYAYVFGSGVFLTFVVQVVTGIWQLFYFVPSIDHAYDSLSYLRLQVPFGWLIHGLHHWGANAMIILVGLHMSRVFIWGGYKHPRQLTWLIGVGLLIFTLALGFTGPVLPWGQRGYWEAEVGTSMAGTVPLIGQFTERLLRGGADLGELTLSRFFILHVAILPGILLLFIGLHLIAFRKFGMSGPWDEAKRKSTDLFWPDQVLKDTIFFSLIFVILVGLSAYASPPVSGPLDLLATS
jgi:ubiquinol-cytochrome c reductase cytochrome b subunit